MADGYFMSVEKVEAATKGRVIVLSGPSGAGKTTLQDFLLKDKKFKGRILRSISATTRAPRGKEVNGRDYVFLSQKMFEYKIASGQFLEWAKIYNNYYGTTMKSARVILGQGKSLLLCIDVQGAAQVEQKIPSALKIFVKTPTLEVLRDRLIARRTDDVKSIEVRMKAAAEELACAKQYNYIIVNDDLERAYAELSGIIAREIMSERDRR